jgi:hypothetical protein
MAPYLAAAISIVLVLSSVACQGPLGVEGPTGSTGKAGAPGPQGGEGIAGPQGPEGAKGKDGQGGATGETGSPGPQGTIGATGAVGAQGWAGRDGAPGVQGERGRRGFLGPVADNTLAIAVNTSNQVFVLYEDWMCASPYSCLDNPNNLPAPVSLSTRHLARDWEYHPASAWTEIQSVTLSVPSAGWVIVHATGHAELFAFRGARLGFQGAVAISASESGVVTPDYAEPFRSSAPLESISYDVSHAYCFSASGSQTYRALATASLVAFTPHMLTAIHYPGTC